MNDMNSSGRSTVIRSLLPTGRQPVAAGVAAALLALAAGWALLPHGNKEKTVDWFADLCSTVSRPMFSSAPAPAGSESAARPATS